MWRARSGDRHDRFQLACGQGRGRPCACLGQPREVAPTGCSFCVFNQLIEEETCRSTAVLGLQTGTIRDILIAPVSSVRSLPVGPRARFDL